MVEGTGVFSWFGRFSRNQKFGIACICALLFYTISGFLAAPAILKVVLEKKLPQFLGRQVTINKIRLNPYTLSATIEGFRLAKKNGDEHFVYFDRLYGNLEILSIFKKALIIKSISLVGPSIDLEFLGDQTYSFSDLIEGKSSTKESGEEEGDALFSINNIEITSGEIKYLDQPKAKSHLITNLNLSIPSVSNLPSNIETYVQPAFSAVINGTLTSLGGQTKPFHDSLATEIDINMKGINISEYMAYVPNPIGLAVKSAMMDIDAGLMYLSGKDSAPRLSLSGEVTLREINVVDREDHSYFKVPSLKVVFAESNLLEKKIHLAEISVDSPQVRMVRQAGGDIFPLSLLGTADENDNEMAIAGNVDMAEEQVSVELVVDSINLASGEFLFSDRSLKSPAEVEVANISVQGANISNIPESVGNISYAMLLNKSGRISGEGTLIIAPLSVKSSLDVNSILLKDFQPYLSEHLQIIISSGKAAVHGDLEVRQEGGGLSRITFAGQSSIVNFATTDSLMGDDLFKWKDLTLNKIHFSSFPQELLIDDIKWQGLYTKVLINEDGTLNLATLGKGENKDDTEPTPADKDSADEDQGDSPNAKVAINEISLSNGQVQFQDRNIKPAYGLSLTSLNGVITGLSSDTESRAIISFDGKVDQQSPLKISGVINPLSEKTFADIKIDFTDFNLSPLSPYSGKYVGFKTDKGKLHLDLEYKIDGRKLESINKAFLDQFTLGDKVDSPDATSLPVNLAISLLKDRQGGIILDIPVSGELDDPEFSVGGVVVRVLVNLIAKAATSPFALLGNLIPEGEDLTHIEFEAGSGKLSKDITEKLDMVANVLYERPGLKMDVSGWIDRNLDSDSLARISLEKQIKLEKAKKSGQSKKKDIDYMKISVAPDEYIKHLTRLYKRALKASPAEIRKAAEEDKVTTEAENQTRMEKFLLSGIKIGDEDLRLLAIDRANSVLRYLIEKGQVDSARLFLLEPQMSGANEGAQKLSSMTMVELSIK